MVTIKFGKHHKDKSVTIRVSLVKWLSLDQEINTFTSNATLHFHILS